MSDTLQYLYMEEIEIFNIIFYTSFKNIESRYFIFSNNFYIIFFYLTAASLLAE